MSKESRTSAYIAFISYRHKPLDSSVAKKIQRSIENFVVPKEYRTKYGGRHLGKVFRDEDELSASANLSDRITEALDHTQYLIVICTPDLPQSHWCEEEIKYFLKTHDRDHLLAVLADGEPEGSFSPYMLHTFDEDGNITANYEPLAANLKQPYKKEFIRLCAAMLDCPFDSLWQRDRRKRANLRMGVFAGTALLLAAVASVVLVKNKQINEQKSLSEKRLSEALVRSGETKLQTFDRYGAIEDAVQALDIDDPTKVDPKVDYLLSRALGAYQVNDPVTEIYYENKTDILDLRVSDDASTLIIIDKFGTITCIDRSRGTPVWDHATGDVWTQIYTDNLGQKVIYKSHNEVCCLSMTDGQVLWSYTHHYGMFFQVLSHDGSLFAIMDRISDDPAVYKSDAPLYLVLLNTKDGSEYGRVSLSHESFSDRPADRESLSEQGGTFSENDKQLIISVAMDEPLEEENSTQSVHVFYAIDLETLERTQIGRSLFLQQFYYGIDISDDASEVFIALHSINAGGVVTIRGTKGDDGYSFDINVIHHDITTAEAGTANGFYGQYPRFHMLTGTDLYVIVSDDRLIFVRKSDNVLLKTYSIEEGIIRSIYWKDRENRTLELTASKGWLIDMTFNAPENEGNFMERYVPIQTDQNEICIACCTGDGLIDVHTEGQLYTIPGSAPNQILCTQYYSDPHAKNLYKADENASLYGAVFVTPDSSCLVSNSNDSILVFNIESSETHVYETTDLSGIDLVLDEGHILYKNEIYSIGDGTKDTFAEPFHSENGWDLVPEKHIRLNNGTIASYTVDHDYDTDSTDYLFWIDGKLIDAVLHVFSTSYSSSLYSSCSGWMVLYGIPDRSDESVSFQCLNLITGQKSQIQDNIPQDDDFSLAFGKQTSIMACGNADGSVYLFDLEENISKPLPVSYADEGIYLMSFSDDDKYFLLLTKTGRLDIYLTETYEEVYSEIAAPVQERMRESYQSGRSLAAYNDLDVICSGHTMEVFFMSSPSVRNAILIDMSSWTLQAELRNVKGYDPATGAIYYWDLADRQLCTYPLYSREDLAAWAQEELSK